MGISASVAASDIQNNVENSVNTSCNVTANCSQVARIGTLTLDNVNVTGGGASCGLIQQGAKCSADCDIDTMVDTAQQANAKYTTDADIGSATFSAAYTKLRNDTKTAIDSQCNAATNAQQTATVQNIMVSSSTVPCEFFSIVQNADANAACAMAVTAKTAQTAAASSTTGGGLSTTLIIIIAVAALIVVILMVVCCCKGGCGGGGGGASSGGPAAPVELAMPSKLAAAEALAPMAAAV